MIFRLRKPEGGDGTVAAGSVAAASPAELLEEVEALTRANRERRDLELDRRILRLRHLAGIELLGGPPAGAGYAAPSGSLPDGAALPEVAPSELTPELVRAAILGHGCLLVRGLFARDEALGLADGIERAFRARDALEAARPAPEGDYEEFALEPRFGELADRPWIKEAGGVLAVDAPKVSFDMFDAFERAALRDVVNGYLGERAVIAAQKCTLRKVEPELPGAWHQDGKFLGDVRALNVWISLSRCGDEAPGLDVVPRRIDHLLASGEEAGTILWIHIPDELVEETAGDAGVVRPIFEPGDALFFDELFLHQTASDPAMPNPRYAIESWFFAPSGFPGDYAPLAV
jgi:hypothetical protein